MDGKYLLKEINNLTRILIDASISEAQNFPTLKNIHGVEEVSFPNGDQIGRALKNISYNMLYEELDEAKCYNMKFIDGALVQLMYRVHNGCIISHRLAFFPSPLLEDYQNDPATYDEDEIYSDIISRRVIPTPLRFDFCNDLEKHKEIYHSQSHLTLGQYSKCRIPVSSPLMPKSFIAFLMRHLYVGEDNEVINQKIYQTRTTLPEGTITSLEKTVSHFIIAE